MCMGRARVDEITEAGEESGESVAGIDVYEERDCEEGRATDGSNRAKGCVTSGESGAVANCFWRGFGEIGRGAGFCGV